MSNAPSKIHLTSQAYLSSWTVDGRLQRFDKRYPSLRPRLKSPAGVGWRERWWGEDPGLNAACEQSCSTGIEKHIPDLLANLEDRWPLVHEERVLLAELAALHALRTPTFIAWLTRQQAENDESYRDQFEDERAWRNFNAWTSSEGYRAERTLHMINKLSTLIGSMHWTLVTFDEPLLLTCDQPVSPVPMALGRPISAFAAGGWINTVEIRFPLTPWLALLGTWHIGETLAPVAGSWQDAMHLNAALREQADWQWFATPTRMPPLPPTIYLEPNRKIDALGPRLLPGYDLLAAHASALRTTTNERLDRLVQEQDSNTIVIVTPRLPDASGELIAATRQAD